MGRDLIDLSHAAAVFDGLNTQRVVDLFTKYLEASDKHLIPDHWSWLRQRQRATRTEVTENAVVMYRP
jgi:hypothetical protein